MLITHLHSDHITDLNDVITTRWVMTFEPTPLTIAHHDDLDAPPQVDVIQVDDGPIELPGAVTIRCAPSDHKPVEPSVGFRLDHGGPTDPKCHV